MPEQAEKPLPKSLRAFQLRVAGFDYAAIAEQLKISRKMAETYVAAELEKALDRGSEDGARLDLARLNQMLTALWKSVHKGDVKAIIAANDIMDRIREAEAKVEPEKESDLDRVRGERERRVGA